MYPFRFKQANKVLDRPVHIGNVDFLMLPVFTDGEQCVSCWKLSFIERIQVLLFGRIWLCIRSGYTQPPVWLDCSRTVFERKE